MAEHHTTPGLEAGTIPGSLQHGRQPGGKGLSFTCCCALALRSSAVPVLAEALGTAAAVAWVGLAG